MFTKTVDANCKIGNFWFFPIVKNVLEEPFKNKMKFNQETNKHKYGE